METLHIVREIIKRLPILPRDKLRLITAWDNKNQISSTLESAFQTSSQAICIPICLQCESQSYIARYLRTMCSNQVSPTKLVQASVQPWLRAH